jgi:FAD:protein FMN transferase
MHRRHFLMAGLGLGAMDGLQAMPGGRWHTRSLVGLGTTLNLQVWHATPSHAEKALDAAVAVLREVEASMSLFRPDSELQRLNRDGVLPRPSAHLQEVLGEALHVARRSGGDFDPTVQPLWQAWDRATRQQRPPTAHELDTARARTGWRDVDLSPAQVRLRRPGMGLTLNGIAQGYAADAVQRVLRLHGVDHALLDTGEQMSWGRNPRGQAWTLGIEDPHDTGRLVTAVRPDGRALATSADHRSAFTPDHRHHHILDPRLGDSPQFLSSVSVLAASAMRADALTKVMFMATPETLPALAHRWGVDVVWVDKQGRWGATPGVTLVNT